MFQRIKKSPFLTFALFVIIQSIVSALYVSIFVDVMTFPQLVVHILWFVTTFLSLLVGIRIFIVYYAADTQPVNIQTQDWIPYQIMKTDYDHWYRSEELRADIKYLEPSSFQASTSFRIVEVYKDGIDRYVKLVSGNLEGYCPFWFIYPSGE